MARGGGRDAGPGRGRRGVRRAMANVKVAVRVRPLSKRCVGAPRGGSVTSCGAGTGKGAGKGERPSGAPSGSGGLLGDPEASLLPSSPRRDGCHPA